jgi:hypothetical protein
MKGVTDPRLRLVPFFLLVTAIVVALVAAVWLIRSNGQANGDAEYFPQTRHNVKGDFLKFFRERGGIARFGFPITEEFDLEGRRVQYFQRARMELHPANDPATRVQLSPLAEDMGLGEPAIPASQIPDPDDPNRRYFAETGHTTEFSFLRFFNENGGVESFGYPITEVFTENGRRVQYLQYARMELDLDRQQVQLADLGVIHFDFADLDPILRRGVAAIQASASDAPTGPTLIRPEPSVDDAYAAYPGSQTLHVYVTDENNRGVPNAHVDFVVEYPDAPQQHDMPPTDENGYTSLTFPLRPSPVGQKVVVRVNASVGTLFEQTQISLFPWR